MIVFICRSFPHPSCRRCHRSLQTSLQFRVDLIRQSPQLLFLLVIAAGHLVNFMCEFGIAEQTDLSEFMFLLVVLGHLLAWCNAFGENGHAGNVAIYQVLGARAAAEGYSHYVSCSYISISIYVYDYEYDCDWDCGVIAIFIFNWIIFLIIDHRFTILSLIYKMAHLHFWFHCRNKLLQIFYSRANGSRHSLAIINFARWPNLYSCWIVMTIHCDCWCLTRNQIKTLIMVFLWSRTEVHNF